MIDGSHVRSVRGFPSKRGGSGSRVRDTGEAESWVWRRWISDREALRSDRSDWISTRWFWSSCCSCYTSRIMADWSGWLDMVLKKKIWTGYSETLRGEFATTLCCCHYRSGWKSKSKCKGIDPSAAQMTAHRRLIKRCLRTKWIY